jgi:hypothetical protein
VAELRARFRPVLEAPTATIRLIDFDLFVLNPARPGCRRPLMLSLSTWVVTGAAFVRQQNGGLFQAMGRLQVVIPSRRQACPQWYLGPPVMVGEATRRPLDLDGWAQVPLSPLGDDGRG